MKVVEYVKNGLGDAYRQHFITAGSIIFLVTFTDKMETIQKYVLTRERVMTYFNTKIRIVDSDEVFYLYSYYKI
jgi:hypothetical protein